MKGYLWAAFGGLVEFVIGAWVIVVPWLVGFQSSSSWGPATRTGFWTGLLLVVIGLITVIGFIVAAFGEQARRLHAADVNSVKGEGERSAVLEQKPAKQAPVMTHPVEREDIERVAYQLLQELKRESR